jgi:hypothetical protein
VATSGVSVNQFQSRDQLSLSLIQFVLLDFLDQYPDVRTLLKKRLWFSPRDLRLTLAQY